MNVYEFFVNEKNGNFQDLIVIKEPLKALRLFPILVKILIISH